MERSFIASSPHFSGAIQRTFLQANDPQEAAQKVENSNEWKTIQSQQYPKQTGKKQRFDSLSHSLCPSHTQWKKETPLGKTLSFFAGILHLFEKLWPHRPPKIDHRLFHSLASSHEGLSNSSLRISDTQPQLHDVLDVTLRFLRKEKKREKIPASLLAELTQCKAWARQLASVKRSKELKKQEKVTKKISQEIGKKLQKTKPGTSLLVPGGVLGRDPTEDCRCFYRITKQANDRFDIQIISRDPELQDAVSLPAAGKEKILPEMMFTGLSAKETLNTSWWNALLNLQMEKKEDSLHAVSTTPIKELFRPFAEKRSPPSTNPKDFATAKNKSTHGQNLWRVIDCIAFPNEKKSERLERFHLKRDLSLFNQFFQTTYSQIENNATYQQLLQEGIENISRKASLLFERGVLEEKEIASIQKELTVVETTLDKAKNGSPNNPKKKWYKDLIKSPTFRFTYPSSQLKKLPLTKKPPSSTPTETVQGREPASLPQETQNISLTPLLDRNIASLSLHEIVAYLPTFRKECEQLHQQKQSALVQRRIQEVFLQFPFSASPNFFAPLSSEEAVHACQEIQTLSQLLGKTSKETRILLPEHVILLTKMGYVLYQIAGSKPKTSRIVPWFGHTYLKNNLRFLEHGTTLTPPCREKPYAEILKKMCEIEKTNDRLHHKLHVENHIIDNAFGKTTVREQGQSYSVYTKESDIFSVRKKRKKNAIVQAICQHIDTIESLLPIKQKWKKGILTQKYADGSHFSVSDQSGYRFEQSWLRPFAHGCFRMALSYAHIDSTCSKQFHHPLDRYRKENNISPEAVTDDPESFLQDIATKGIAPFPNEKNSLPPHKKEDLRDILFVLTEKLSLQNVMGLLQNKPHLLSSPDVRAICYHAPFDRKERHFDDKEHRSIEKDLFTLECEENPAIIDEFPRWLHKQIAFFSNQGKIDEALFLIELQQRWVKKCQEAENKSIQEGANKARDFLPSVQDWARQSLQPNHPLAKHKNRIWREMVHLYAGKESLSLEDMELLSTARIVLRSTPTDPHDRAVHKEEEILYVLDRSKEPILAAIRSNPALRNAFLDRMCQAQGVSVPPSTSWAGEGPSYKLGDYEIDIREGIFTDHKTGATNRPFSSDMIHDSAVTEAFSTLEITNIPTTAKVEKKQTHYFFVDGKNNPSHIVTNGKERQIYKEFSINGKTRALQYLPRRMMIPNRIDPQILMEKHTMKEIIQVLWKLFKQLLQPPFPTFLSNDNFRFWIDPQHPKDVFVFDKEGSPLYQFQFSRRFSHRVLTKGADLRKGTDAVVLQPVQTLPRKTTAFWRPFSQFDDPGNILVWRNKKREVDRVDILRFGLSFAREGDNLVCTHPSYRGWIYEGKEQTTVAKRSLKGTLLLTHPTQKDKKKVLVPRHPVRKKGNFFDSLSTQHLLRLGMQHLKRQFPSLPVDDPLASLRKKSSPSTQGEFSSFDIDPHTLSWTTNTPKAGEHFLHVSLSCLQEGNCNKALEFLHLAKKHIAHSLSTEESELLQKIIGYKIHTPQSTALQLHALLLWFAHGDTNDKELNTSLFGTVYKKCIEYGHKIPNIYRLTKEEEAISASLLLQTDPAFAERHLLHIFPANAKGKPIEKLSLQEKEWHQRLQPHTLSVREIASQVSLSMHAQKEKMDQYKKQNAKFLGRIQRKFSLQEESNPEKISYTSRSQETIAPHFDQLYKIARDGALDSHDFLQAEAFLCSLGHETNDMEQASALPTLLREYLLNVIDIRHTQPETISQWPVWSSPSSSQENDHSVLESFFTQLDSLQKKLFPPKQTDKTPQIDTQHIQQLVSRMERYFGYNLEEWSDEPIEKNPNKKPLRENSLPSITPSKGALFAPKDVEALFEKRDSRTSAHHIPDLSSLAQDPEPSVLVEKEKIEREVQTAIARKSQEQIYVLRDEEKRQRCLHKTQEERKKIAKSVQEKKEALFDFFQSQSSPLSTLYNQAGFLPETEISDLLKACLQNEWKKFEQVFPPGKTKEDLQALVGDYIDLSSRHVRCKKAVEVLEEMAPDKGGIQRSASDTLYAILTNERQYNPREHLHLAVLELYLGFLLRPNQLQTVIDMVNDPQAVKQAATGAGKTTVINFLNAVMKADGTNLVTMVFPKPLYEENIAYLHQYLGKLYERNTYRLDFSEQTPETVDKGKRSVFQQIYGELCKTMQNRGVVATTRQSMQALEKSFLKRLYHCNKRGDTVEEMEMTHLIYAAKILRLFEKCGVQVVDEFDSILSPKERQDLSMSGGQTIKYPSFLREEVMRVYEKLYAHKELGLDKNIQAERFSQYGETVLDTITNELAAEWQTRTGYDANALSLYFQSKLSAEAEKDLLSQLHTISTEEQDRLAVTKELLTDFIPLALQKKEDGKYKRSENGVDTVNCSSPGVAREGSKPREILETMCYTIQDYLYRGVTPTKIRSLVEDALHQAEKELNPLGKDLDEIGDDHSGQAAYGSIDETPAAQGFLTRFPQSPLSLSAFVGENKEKAIQQLTVWVNSNETQKREFLSEQLAQLEDSSTKISCTSANYVSMTNMTGGASATTGNPHAYPDQIYTQEISHPGTVGEMILTLQEKTAFNQGIVEKYNPEEPLVLIQKCIQEKGVQSLVDGGVALTGALARDIARNLLQQLPSVSSIQGVAFFDESDTIRVLTKDGKEEAIDMSPLRRNQISMTLLASHSRGANIQIGSDNHILMTDHSLETLEGKLQTFGRSRAKDHKITIAIPQDDPITTVDQSIAAGIRAGALEGADNLFRAKQQELDDMIRRNMLTKLLSLAASLSQEGNKEKKKELSLLFQEYQGKESQFLIQERHNDFSNEGTYQPGTYFANHGKILRKDQDPERVLYEKVEELLTLAIDCQLESAQTELERWKSLLTVHAAVNNSPSIWEKDDQDILQAFPAILSANDVQPLRHLHTILTQMPSKVSGKRAYDTETSVDVDREAEQDIETEVNTDVQVNVHEESRKEPPEYLPWREKENEKFAIHTLAAHTHRGYDAKIQTTENAHPLGRKQWADPIFHRTPHDKSQMPLQYIHCEIESTGEWKSITTVDPLDVGKNTYAKASPSNWNFYYDMRTNQTFRMQAPKATPSTTNARDLPKTFLKDLRNYVAQIRFEDGQYQASSYTEGQWEALKQWLQQQDRIETEKYFLGEVLKNRPDDRAQYKGSDLNKLFIKLKQEKVV